MTPEMLTAIRAALMAAGGGFVTSGTITGGQLEQLAGAVVFVATLAWSIYSKRAGSKEAQAVSARVTVTAVDNAKVAAGADKAVEKEQAKQAQ